MLTWKQTHRSVRYNVLKLEALDAWREENRVGDGRDFPQTAPLAPQFPVDTLVNGSCAIILNKNATALRSRNMTTGI